MSRTKRDKHKTSQSNHRKLAWTASGLLFAIAVLAIIQWATAFRGDLLWVAMTGLGIVLMGVLLSKFPGRLPTTKVSAESKSDLEYDSGLPWNQPSWHDPSDLGSPVYRDD